MALINRNPAGALELLNLNLQGEYPRDLAGSIISTVETSPFYYHGIGITAFQSIANILVAGGSTSVTVPAGETWAMRACSGRISNLDPNAIVQFSIEWSLPGTVDVDIVFMQPTTALQTQWVAFGSVFDNPILIPSGHSIRLRNNLLGGVPVAGIDCVLNVLVHRLTLA